MADIPQPPVPGGPVSPMKKSTGKVQPKKETVRINLPPKPSAAPTIKLPTLPPGGPTGAPSGVAAAPAAAARPPSAAAPAAAQRTTTAAPVSQARPAPAVQRAPAPVVKGMDPLDQILAIAAAVVGLAAIGTTLWMMFVLNTAVTQ